MRILYIQKGGVGMELFSRHPRGDSKITDFGVRIEGEFVSIIRDYLKTIEDDGAIDLLDLSIILKYSVSDVIHQEIVMRRCSAKPLDTEVE
jgi:hypothetical protein